MPGPRDLSEVRTATVGAQDGRAGGRFDLNDPTAGAFLIEQDRRVRLEFINAGEMRHPMHLHGRTFQVGNSGPRKDTVLVKPKQRVVGDFDADNPGRWMVHCHNACRT
ncbi:multicopper oxidase domain-containing protein [Kitasatospora griseola]|uniref:multicopper oxidase domain-containing protein n=1 Tax=Kitasatospora griseola TaxID=2064 RepID=UPI0034397046